MRPFTVVVPVYNEEECLPRFYERITAIAASLPLLAFEFLFVDDGSTDRSYSILEELSARDRRVKVLRFSRNFGSYTALAAGLAHASGDAAITLSADLQDPPELIPEMVKHWLAGRDVVWAVRRSRTQDPLWRRMSSQLFYSVFRRIAFPNYPPKGYDFCLVSRVVLDNVARNLERNSSVFALIVWAGFDSVAIPYDRAGRVAGVSHWNLRKMVRLAIDAVISFSSLPVRLSLWMSVTVGIGLFGYLGYILYGKLTGALQFPAGWPSTMSVILLTSGMQFLVLAILGEYLWRTLEQTRGRPPFVVSRKHGFEERESLTEDQDYGQGRAQATSGRKGL